MYTIMDECVFDRDDARLVHNGRAMHASVSQLVAIIENTRMPAAFTCPMRASQKERERERATICAVWLLLLLFATSLDTHLRPHSDCVASGL